MSEILKNLVNIHENIDQTMVTVIRKGIHIDKMKKLLNEAFSKTPKKGIKKYAGVLHTDIDPLEYQKQMRNEWE